MERECKVFSLVTDVQLGDTTTTAALSSIQANFWLSDLVLLLLTATASVFTSSLLSGAVRSISTGHTLVSTSYLSMSSCSNSTNNAAWLVFLTCHKKTKIEPSNSKRVLFAEIHVSCILEAVPVHDHTAVVTAHSERTSAPQVLLQALHVCCPVFWEARRWTPALADNVRVFLGFKCNLF